MKRANIRSLLLGGIAFGLSALALGQASAQDAVTRGVTVFNEAGPDGPSRREAAPSETRPQPFNPNPPAARCNRVFPTADVKFSNAAAFDQALNALLTNPPHSGVIVDADAPFNPDAPPPRLRGWLSAVQKTGGRVEQQDITCTRGFNLGRFLKNLFQPQENPIYAPAKNFNAIMWVEKATGEVTQVQFVGRQPA